MMRLARLIAVAGLLCLPFCPVEAQTKARTVHVFVALADNQHQGIIPVPPALGNGEDPGRNLYWGAAFGVRTYFRRSEDWKELATVPKPKPYILERSILEHRTSRTILVADAYEGSEIKQALTDFFQGAGGRNTEMISVGSATSSRPATCRVRRIWWSTLDTMV